MSMIGMAQLHGHALRAVTSQGRIIFDVDKQGESASSSMPLTKHTFHGGFDDALAEASIAGKPYWLDDGAVERDRIAMATWFPEFVETPGTEDAPPHWEGMIDTGRGRFPVRIILRADRGLPFVVPIGLTKRGRSKAGLWRPAPHLYLAGNLCVASSEDWDPNRDTVATVVGWAAHWHACYVEWLLNGKWPTEGYVDDVA